MKKKLFSILPLMIFSASLNVFGMEKKDGVPKKIEFLDLPELCRANITSYLFDKLDDLKNSRLVCKEFNRQDLWENAFRLYLNRQPDKLKNIDMYNIILMIDRVIKIKNVNGKLGEEFSNRIKSMLRPMFYSDNECKNKEKSELSVKADRFFKGIFKKSQFGEIIKPDFSEKISPQGKAYILNLFFELLIENAKSAKLCHIWGLYFENFFKRNFDDLKKQLNNEININFNYENQYGYTALSYMAPLGKFDNRGKIPFLDWLKSNGSDINHKNKDGFTALMFVSSNNYLTWKEKEPILDWLIKNGADINHKSKYGNTALIRVLTCEDLSWDQKQPILKWLIDHGANICHKNKTKGSCFWQILCWNSNFIGDNTKDVIDYLVDHLIKKVLPAYSSEKNKYYSLVSDIFFASFLIKNLNLEEKKNVINKLFKSINDFGFGPIINQNAAWIASGILEHKYLGLNERINLVRHLKSKVRISIFSLLEQMDNGFKDEHNILKSLYPKFYECYKSFEKVDLSEFDNVFKTKSYANKELKITLNDLNCFFKKLNDVKLQNLLSFTIFNKVINAYNLRMSYKLVVSNCLKNYMNLKDKPEESKQFLLVQIIHIYLDEKTILEEKIDLLSYLEDKNTETFKTLSDLVKNHKIMNSVSVEQKQDIRKLIEKYFEQKYSKDNRI